MRGIELKTKDNAIQLSVSDTSTGLGAEDLARVFEPFAAIENPTYMKGTGLRLSVSMALAEAHGGVFIC